MCILIQGPKQPGVDMHLYIGLLKEELAMLWEMPPRTWDTYGRYYFSMRVALLTMVQDYPGYSYVSGQVNHRHNACVRCMDKTPASPATKGSRFFEDRVPTDSNVASNGSRVEKARSNTPKIQT